MPENPIPKMLHVIPTTFKVVDHVLLDKLRLIIRDESHLLVNNAYVMNLLKFMHDFGGVVILRQVKSDEDESIFIICNIYGRKDLS
jgi:hypothetical protein